MNKKVIATYGLSNTSGIAILNIVYGIEDKVKFSYHNGEKFGRTSTAKIRYNEEGSSFFISGKKRYYLNEFIKSEVF